MSKKHTKLLREQEFRKIIKEQNEIFKKIQKLGHTKLKKPIRHGWFKEIIITQNINRYKNKEAMLELYSKVEKRFWGRTKEYAHKAWAHKTSQYFITRDLPTINRKTYNRLSKEAKACCTGFQYRTEKHKLKTRYYINIPKGAYKIKYTRAYITHTRRIDPNLESRYKYLNNKLKSNKYFKLERNYNSYWYKDWWPDERTQIQEKAIKKDLQRLHQYSIDEIIKDNIIWERN